MLKLDNIAKSANRISGKRETVVGLLRQVGFKFKEKPDYTEGKFDKCNFLYLKITNVKIEVYPIGLWDQWKSNSISLDYFIKEYKNQTPFKLILNNENYVRDTSSSIQRKKSKKN